MNGIIMWVVLFHLLQQIVLAVIWTRTCCGRHRCKDDDEDVRNGCCKVLRTYTSRHFAGSNASELAGTRNFEDIAEVPWPMMGRELGGGG